MGDARANNLAVVQRYADAWKRGDAAAIAVLVRVLVFTIRDDQLSECWLYDRDQRAVDEFWS